MKLRLLSDRIHIELVEYENPLIAVVGISLNKGRVLAVGPGKRQRRKQQFRALDSAMCRAQEFEDGDETGRVYPMHVKVGDYVEFSPRGCVKLEDDTVLIRQGAVYFTTDDSPYEALLFQQSAGYDRDGNFMSGKETAF